MDVAGLTAGSRVKARHKGGTPLAKLLLEDGSTTYWAEEETSGKDAVIAPQEATWLKNGRRDTRRPGVADTTINDQLPRQIEVVTQSDCTGPRLWI